MFWNARTSLVVRVWYYEIFVPCNIFTRNIPKYLWYFWNVCVENWKLWGSLSSPGSLRSTVVEEWECCQSLVSSATESTEQELLRIRGCTVVMLAAAGGLTTTRSTSFFQETNDIFWGSEKLRGNKTRLNECHDFKWSRTLWKEGGEFIRKITILLVVIYVIIAYSLCHTEGMRGIDIPYFIVTSLTTVSWSSRYKIFYGRFFNQPLHAVQLCVGWTWRFQFFTSVDQTGIDIRFTLWANDYW